MTAGIAALIVAGVTIKKVLDTVLPNTREDKKKLEDSLELMRRIRRRYRDCLYDDIRAFAVGPWWERFTSMSDSTAFRSRGRRARFWQADVPVIIGHSSHFLKAGRRGG